MRGNCDKTVGKDDLDRASDKRIDQAEARLDEGKRSPPPEAGYS